MSPRAVNIGDLRDRVEIQHALTTQGTTGEPVESWKSLACVYAHVRPMTGLERSAHDKSEAQASYVVVIRHRDDVMATNRLIYRGKTLGIIYAQNVDSRDRFLELKCVEVS